MRYELCKIADVPATGSRVAPFFGREVHVYRADGAIRAAILQIAATPDTIWTGS